MAIPIFVLINLHHYRDFLHFGNSGNGFNLQCRKYDLQ